MIHLKHKIAFFRESSSYFFYLVSISISREIVSTNSTKNIYLVCNKFPCPYSMIILSSYHFIALGTSRFSKKSHDTLRICSYPDDFEITKVTVLNSVLSLYFLSMYPCLHMYTCMGCKQAYVFNLLSLPVLF